MRVSFSLSSQPHHPKPRPNHCRVRSAGLKDIIGGTEWTNSNINSKTSYRLGFLGLQKDKESNLGDHGVRKYDSEIGRFLVIDPLWEKYNTLNPYQYSGNSPVMMADLNGKNWFSDISEKFVNTFNDLRNYLTGLGSSSKIEYEGPITPPDVPAMANNEMSKTGQALNSPLARTVIPDAVSVGVGATFIPLNGRGLSLDYSLILRGEHRGQGYLTLTGSNLWGVDVGAGAQITGTYSTLPIRNLTPENLLTGKNFVASFGMEDYGNVSYSVSQDFDTQSLSFGRSFPFGIQLPLTFSFGSSESFLLYGIR